MDNTTPGERGVAALTAPVEPAAKSETLAIALDRLLGRRPTIRARGCTRPGCSAPDLSFRDAVSVREYSLSGLCQRCQDVVFTDEEDEP